MSIYGIDYLKNHDVIDETYWLNGCDNAKQTRNNRAKTLRKEGYKTTVKTTSFPDMGSNVCFSLHAIRDKVKR